jgi:BASS family bile acid:Na+ symporter
MLHKLTKAFPFWVLAACILAVFVPSSITWFSGPWITWGLGFIMLGMGLTLKIEDFVRVLEFPWWITLGLLFQFTIMPLLGWLLGYLFALPDYLAIGLILVACCPGGTASNVICYLSKANVALSVSMTSISTLAAIILTPLFTLFLAGARMEVDGFGLFLTTLKVVLLPVTLGVLLNKFFTHPAKRMAVISPLIAVIIIALIVGSIIGSGKAKIIQSGFSLIGAVVILHICGFVFGYIGTKILTKNEQVARTVSIEVGMQNSGLGAVLARQNIPHPAAAIPSAISALTHCMIGSLCAYFWGKQR